MDKVHPTDSECHTLTSEPFRFSKVRVVLSRHQEIYFKEFLYETNFNKIEFVSIVLLTVVSIE
jgi:hypothetical protein